MANVLLTFLIVGIISSGCLFLLCPNLLTPDAPVPTIEAFRWWGRGPAPAGAEKQPIVPKPFKINVPEKDLEDLKKRLARTRYSEPLEEAQFQYGFPSDQLKKVVHYWTKTYNWRTQEAMLNKFNHFKANIEGIDVHYIHAKPSSTKGVKVLPVMVIHGWPGSFVEFLKLIPLLTTPKDGYVFEVFCPSIPGYGYSEAPHKKGFNGAETARMFDKLMTHFHQQYYVLGADWGSLVAQCMGILYPERVRGIHINVCGMPNRGLPTVARLLLGVVAPSLLLAEGEKSNIFPLKATFGKAILESGALHIQSTKPDTVGSSLSDSPAGLAAYILEKFSTWTKDENKMLADGGLTKKFTMDELLTNVMIYWTTNSITSSQRYFKENQFPEFRSSGFFDAKVKVPTGVVNFPNNIVVVPRSFANMRYTNIVTFTYQPRGGHFATIEEPLLFEADFREFVAKNEAILQKQSKKAEK